MCVIKLSCFLSSSALKLDPNDHITYYYLGLHAACHADTTEAINYVKQALKLNPEHTASINLMILLLTAQKQVKESLALVESSLMDFPDNLNFSFLKANIELHHVSGEVRVLFFGGNKYDQLVVFILDV
jgi:Cytochrome c biogenesis factor